MAGHVGVVGAGTMGIGIAQCLLRAGHPVTIVDPDPAALAAGPDRLRRGGRLHSLVGSPPSASRPDPAEPPRWSSALADLSSASWVVECAVERLTVKRRIFDELDEVCAPDAVLTSCTSAIPVARLAAGLRHPGRVAGTHFMNPAPMKATVEVVRGPETTDDSLRRVLDLLAGIGKKGVVTRDAPGFVTNRVLMLMINEAAAVVAERTADAPTVDRIFQDCFGHPMGPLATGDLIGLDTVVDTLLVLVAETGDPRFRPCVLLVDLVAEGRLGRKSGHGFHRYTTSA
ncbi:3-hydroxyacyl-CoA dehydrogenase family protein [Umezawaea sp. Da 62-37]|uniref:3-hydroxyacyl-CoA dehydrogenase family protein n=1 Tax=Umezawaea sp. Da 62-37 TaxID=3075927 RepID=UPI0028F6DB04|nr:3-hydroxyacyl-CoA dehydrogenase family protein [Umezawaea sp. Da 62-37]WNV85206.1 3-hydroxyacyl-CoA dehydrogenase family protein [Umezawaea sp. Da 62-37]